MKICFVTGTRAEYGLLKPLIDKALSEKGWTVQLLVTGAHLSPEFGLTYKQIEEDGLHIDQKVDMQLSSDTAQGIVKSMGIGMIGYADAFQSLQPDLIVILGDRYEMLAVASAALIFKIPIAHLHGGEVTEGAFDDAIRHAITKLSHLHFTSTEEYRKRVIQLGEQPDRVWNVGAIGIDNLSALKLLSKEELQKTLNIKFNTYNYLVSFHPVTLEANTAAKQFQELLEAIDQQKDSFFIFTKANADTGGKIINEMIDEYVARHTDTSVAYVSMGQLKYLSAMQYVDAVVGNSSSGIIEAPSLKKATINIGDRQKGRTQAASVLNGLPLKEDILKQFDALKQDKFKAILSNLDNPYGQGGTSEKIMNALKQIDYSTLITKSFFDSKHV